MEIGKNTMPDYRLSGPVFLRNLVVYPIQTNNRYSHRDDTFDKLNLFTIDEVVVSKRGEFLEHDKPDITEVIFDNKSDFPVVMLDGEEITGSLQNRIVTQSNLVEAMTSKDIPVVCVEEGRWEEIGGFKTGYCSYPGIRTILSKSRHKKINTQQIIWKEINRKLTVTRTQSATSSMHDIYDNLKEEVVRYVEDFQSFNHNTVGFIGIAGNRILGCDFFQSPEIYGKFEHKLLRSYALDAIEYQKIRGNHPDAEKFLDSILDVLRKKRVGKTTSNIKIKDHGFFGQALVYHDDIIHLSAFPK